MNFRDREARVIAQAQGDYAEHQAKERISRSFDFRKPCGSGIYAFSLTWTPGTLALAGDVGELTLSHYHALRDLEPGLAWATSSDHDYLLSKSNAEKEFDREGTVDGLLEFSRGEDNRSTREAIRRALRLDERLHGAALYSVMRKELAREFEEFGGERAGEWIYNLRNERGCCVFDDWYGDRSWAGRALYQIEAIRHGARLALQMLAEQRGAAA